MAVCDTPAVICHNPFLQDPMTQRVLLLRLMCAAAQSMGSQANCTDDALKTQAANWACQGSAEKIRQLQMQMICDSTIGFDCSQPVCWTPLQIEGAMAYVICEIINQLEGEQV